MKLTWNDPAAGTKPVTGESVLLLYRGDVHEGWHTGNGWRLFRSEAELGDGEIGGWMSKAALLEITRQHRGSVPSGELWPVEQDFYCEHVNTPRKLSA
jgi:hypothetical protein